MEHTPVLGSSRTVPLSGPGAPTLYLARPIPAQMSGDKPGR